MVEKSALSSDMEAGWAPSSTAAWASAKSLWTRRWRREMMGARSAARSAGVRRERRGGGEPKRRRADGWLEGRRKGRSLARAST